MAPARNNALVVGGLVAALALGGGIAWAATSSGGTPPAPTPDPPATAATAPVTPPTPPAVPEAPPATPPSTAATTAPAVAGPTVRVQITTVPEGAELFLDGNPIGNPFDADLPSNTAIHHLEARMTGRVTAARDISLAFPQRIVLELEREGRGGTRPSSSGGTASTGGSSGGTTASPPSGSSSGGTSTVAAPPDPPPVRPPPEDPPAAADPPPAGGSSGGRTLRNPFGH